jgi:hypothetical protein
VLGVVPDAGPLGGAGGDFDGQLHDGRSIRAAMQRAAVPCSLGSFMSQGSGAARVEMNLRVFHPAGFLAMRILPCGSCEADLAMRDPEAGS